MAQSSIARSDRFAARLDCPIRGGWLRLGYRALALPRRFTRIAYSGGLTAVPDPAPCRRAAVAPDGNGLLVPCYSTERGAPGWRQPPPAVRLLWELWSRRGTSRTTHTRERRRRLTTRSFSMS